MKGNFFIAVGLTLLATVSQAAAGTVLPDAVYSGSLDLSASGYICQNFSCTPQAGNVNPSVSGPGTLSPATQTAPLISDGTSGSIPATDNSVGASAGGS